LHGGVFILAFGVDHIVANEKLHGAEANKRFMSANFEVRDMGEIKDCICMTVVRNRAPKTLTLSNPAHTATLLEAFGREKGDAK